MDNIAGNIHTKDYCLTIEVVGVDYFCHLNIYNWSVSAYKKMLIDLQAIVDTLSSDLFCCIAKKSKKEKKLVEMFGFFPILEDDSKYIMRLN